MEGIELSTKNRPWRWCMICNSGLLKRTYQSFRCGLQKAEELVRRLDRVLDTDVKAVTPNSYCVCYICLRKVKKIEEGIAMRDNLKADFQQTIVCNSNCMVSPGSLPASTPPVPRMKRMAKDQGTPPASVIGQDTETAAASYALVYDTGNVCTRQFPDDMATKMHRYHAPNNGNGARAVRNSSALYQVATGSGSISMTKSYSSSSTAATASRTTKSIRINIGKAVDSWKAQKKVFDVKVLRRRLAEVKALHDADKTKNYIVMYPTMPEGQKSLEGNVRFRETYVPPSLFMEHLLEVHQRYCSECGPLCSEVVDSVNTTTVSPSRSTAADKTNTPMDISPSKIYKPASESLAVKIERQETKPVAVTTQRTVKKSRKQNRPVAQTTSRRAMQPKRKHLQPDMKTIYRPMLPFECKSCKRHFHSFDRYKTHQERLHSCHFRARTSYRKKLGNGRIRSRPCWELPEVVKWQRGRKRHSCKTTCFQETKLYRCAQCRKYFVTKSKWMEHARTHQTLKTAPNVPQNTGNRLVVTQPLGNAIKLTEHTGIQPNLGTAPTVPQNSFNGLAGTEHQGSTTNYLEHTRIHPWFRNCTHHPQLPLYTTQPVMYLIPQSSACNLSLNLNNTNN